MTRPTFFALTLAAAVLAAGGLWRSRARRIDGATKLEIHEIAFAGERSGRLRLRATGEEARQHTARFRITDDGFCNLCLSPSSKGWFRFRFSEGASLLYSADVQLPGGQVSSPGDRCLRGLDETSQKYFAALLGASR